MTHAGGLNKAITILSEILEHNITKEMREKLNKALSFLQQAKTSDLFHIGDYFDDGIVLLNANGIILYVNKANQDMFSIPWNECVGNSAIQFVGDILISNAITMEVITNQKGYSAITFPRRNDRQLLQTGIPLYDENGEFEGALIIDRDISEIMGIKEKLSATETLLAQTEEIHQKQAQLLNVLVSKHNNTGNYVYTSELMRNTVEQAIQISCSDANTLITGETGSGKEVIADIIQAHSDRCDKPYVKVNCAAIPESLIESELFGHEKGAFTGAASGKPGMFELANKGTLFLDEIGELPLAFQPKVLRALQSKQIMRVGGVKLIGLDVRVIAATNRDLKTMVNAGTFREDLYYRLNVLPLHVPPLRERLEDIDVLVRSFLSHFNKKYGKSLCIDPFVYHNLKQYEWPGNIRELENLIERWVVVHEPHLVLQWPHVENAFKGTANLHASCGGGGGGGRTFKMRSMAEIMNEYQKEVLLWAAAEYGSMRKMAEGLGVDHSTIVKQVKRLGLQLFNKNVI